MAGYPSAQVNLHIKATFIFSFINLLQIEDYTSNNMNLILSANQLVLSSSGQLVLSAHICKPLFRFTSQLNGYTALCLTKTDILDKLDEVKIGVAYVKVAFLRKSTIIELTDQVKN